MFFIFSAALGFCSTNFQPHRLTPCRLRCFHSHCCSWAG